MADTPEPEGIPTPDGTTLPPPAPVVDKVDIKNDLQLEIEGAGDGLSLKIYVRAPQLAEVVRKMAPSNWERSAFAPVFKPILLELPQNKERVITRGAISKATKNFVGAATLDFNEPPPAILLANPDALAEGYTLIHKLEKPCPPDVIKKWGKQFMEGCGDIMTAARPFKFAWAMQQVSTFK